VLPCISTPCPTATRAPPCSCARADAPHQIAGLDHNSARKALRIVGGMEPKSGCIIKMPGLDILVLSLINRGNAGSGIKNVISLRVQSLHPPSESSPPYQGENRRGGPQSARAARDYGVECALALTFDNRRLCERG